MKLNHNIIQKSRLKQSALLVFKLLISFSCFRTNSEFESDGKKNEKMKKKVKFPFVDQNHPVYYGYCASSMV